MQFFDRDLSQSKGYRDGTHRMRSPRETIDRFAPLARHFGITRISNVTGLDTVGIPVYVAMRPNARSLTSSQGKGLTPDEARASALMEAIELWHGEHVELPLRWESHARLRRCGRVADIARLPLAPGAAIRTDVPLLWVEGFDLLAGAPAWVPFDCVTTNFVRTPDSHTTFRPSSNGLASGNHLLEAISHGLCELIERDSVARWDRLDDAEQKQTQVDPETVESARCRRVIDAITAAGLRVGLFDATAETGIPTYICWVFAEPTTDDWRMFGVYHGMGSHLSPEVALLRALTEAVQSRLTEICGVRDDIRPSQYQNHANRDDLQRAWDCVEGGPAPRRFGGQPDRSTDTFEGDVELLLAALAGQGLDSAIAVDLSRAEHGVPVCKVIVPGLSRHGAPGARTA